MLLTETYIRITVTVLYADNIVADNCYSGTISCKLLVGGFGIILSRFNELVVKTKSYSCPLLNTPVDINDLTRSSFIVSAVLKSYVFPETVDL